jgi:peptide/nickel transport system substrate-binding protein
MKNDLRAYLRTARFIVAGVCSVALFLFGCSGGTSTGADAGTVNFLLDFMPLNLDPRIGSDAQSERISSLLFSGLVEMDEQRNLRADLAERWENPDPLTYIFYLRRDVRFHDGRPLTSADVKFTFDSVTSGAIVTPKIGAFRLLRAVEAPDAYTVIFRLSEPYASFLWGAIARPAMGIVPAGSAADFASHPIGTGPFRFVRASQDEEVVIERNPDYFRSHATVERVHFRIVPDAIVRALELRKGTADIEVGSLTPDMVDVMKKDGSLAVTQRPGTNYSYIAMNFNDPHLAHREVRQALAHATDRESIVRHLLRGQARLAESLLPPSHWAHEENVQRYLYDPHRAELLLDSAGFPRRPELANMRLRLELKSSTDETARLLGAVLQEQWRRVGVDLSLRSLENATFRSDITRGAFQLYALRWVGGNNDPDIFEFAFHSKNTPPGANRGYYRNSRLDELVDRARIESDRSRRRELISEVQQIVSHDLPYLHLWYMDAVAVHRRRISNVGLEPNGNYDFLTRITIN